MFNKSKLIIRACIPIVLLFMLLVGLTTCKHPTSSEAGETYTVTFNASGGTPVPEPLVVSAGSRIKAPEGLKKSYYTIGGWYREPEFKTLWDFENDIVTHDITLYAKWGTSGGPGTSSGRGYIPGTPASNYNQTIIFRETVSLIPGLVEIDFTHLKSTGPLLSDGDPYDIALKGNHISTGTIQVLSLDQHHETIIFIPADGGYPFIGELDLDHGILSIDDIPYGYDFASNTPPKHITIPGAAMDNGSGAIEGNSIAQHDHLNAAFEHDVDGELDLIHFIDADTITFKNQNVPDNYKTKGSWIIGYETGYYGWTKDDMTEVSATHKPGGFSLANSKVGRGIKGKWLIGGSIPATALHIQIAQNQQSLLQFKGGGAPYRLELDDDYGTGSTVGYIEITATGSTSIVTFKLHLEDGYNLTSPAYVNWSSTNVSTSSDAYRYLSTGFPISKKETPFVFTGVPSNTKFLGATFDGITSSSHPELEFDSASTAGILFFVDDAHNEIIVDERDFPYPYKTKAECDFIDCTSSPLTAGGEGWIFEIRDLAYNHGDTYYETSIGPPEEYIAKSQTFKDLHNNQDYYFDPAGSDTFYYYETLDDIYYYDSTGPCWETFNGVTLAVDKVPPAPDTIPDGPTFVRVSPPGSYGPLEKEYIHGNVITHAVQNIDLKVHGDEVGMVHVEYNRYEPEIDATTPKVPYSLTITYYFDEDYKTIMNRYSPTWNYTCEFKINGLPVPAGEITSMGNNVYVIIREEPFPLALSSGEIDVTLEIKTEFLP